MKVKFHWRLTLFFCFVTLLASLSGYIYLIGQAKAYIEHNAFVNMRRQISLGKEYLEQYLTNMEAPAELHTIALKMEKSLGVHVAIIKADGKVFGDVESVKGQLPAANLSDAVEVRDALYNGFAVSRSFNHFFKNNMLSMAVPFGKNKVKGVLRFSVPLGDTELLYARLSTIVGATIIVVLALSVLFGGIATAEIRASLKKINAGKEYLDNIINSVGGPIFVKDRKHRWVLLNNAYCEFMGYPRETLIGKSDYDFFPKEEADVFWIKDESVFCSRSTNINEEKFTDAKGITHTIVTKKVLYESAQGEEYIVGIINDITELKRLEQIKDSLTHMIIHDLNNPLSVLSTELQLLKLDAEKSFTVQQKDGLEVSLIASQDLQGMVENLLDINGMEEGKIKLQREALALGDIVRQVADQMQAIARHSQVTLLPDIAGEIPPVSGDKEIIKRVVANLVKNALKFSLSHSVVSLKVFCKDDTAVYVQVKDSGMGIPKEYLEKIFDKFFQVEMKKERVGRGLGLTFCRMMVEACGGRIWAESEGRNKGATLTFTLPVLYPLNVGGPGDFATKS